VLPLILLGLLSTPLFFVISAHALDDQNSEANVNNQARDDTLAQSNETVFIHSTVQNRSIENTYGLLFSTSSGISLHMESSSVNDVRQIENPANPSLNIVYESLVEFNDTNGNGAFDPGQDTVVRSVNLATETYAIPQIREVVSKDGGQGWQLVSRTLDGVFTVSTETFETTAQIDGATIPPTATRVVVTVNASRLNSSSDHIALQTVVMSSSPFDTLTASGSSLTARSGSTQEYFSWNPTSAVDNLQAPVTGLTRQTNGYVTVNLAYPRGGIVTHDMFIGVIFGTTPLLTTTLLIGSSIAALLLFGILFVAGKREYSRAYLRRNNF
jgi:hypothetical protein